MNLNIKKLKLTQDYQKCDQAKAKKKKLKLTQVQGLIVQ